MKKPYSIASFLYVLMASIAFSGICSQSTEHKDAKKPPIAAVLSFGNSLPTENRAEFLTFYKRYHGSDLSKEDSDLLKVPLVPSSGAVSPSTPPVTPLALLSPVEAIVTLSKSNSNQGNSTEQDDR